MLCSSRLRRSLVRLIQITINRHSATTQMAVRVRNIAVSPPFSNTRFTMGVRGSFGGVPLVEKRCSRSLCQSDIVGLWKSCRPSARYKTTDSHACSGFGEPRTRTKKRSKSKCFVSCRGGARDPSRSRLSLYRVVPNLSWPELLISLNISLLAQQASKRSSVLASRRCEGGESRFTAFALVSSLS